MKKNYWIIENNSINVTNKEIKNRTATVKGKGKKIRNVHFSEECAIVLREYLEKRNDDEPAAFLNKHGKRLESYGVDRVVIKLGKNAGLP